MAMEIEDEEKKGVDAGGGVVNPDGQGAEGGGGGTAGGGEIPVPVRQNRNAKEYGEFEAPYDQNDINKAKKQGRRESRMATAGHIMDTMARLFNYGATVNGGPSAKWANRNQEFDENTYYAKLKGANDKARQNYWDMRQKLAKADNDEYQADVNLYDKQKKWKDKEAQREADQPGKDAETEKKKAEAESQRIRNMYLPDELAEDINVKKSQATENYSSAAKNNRENEEYVIYQGNGQYKKYPKTQKNEWGQEVRALAQKNGISLTKEVQTVTNKTGNKASQTVVTKTVDKTDDELAKELASKMRTRESGN